MGAIKRVLRKARKLVPGSIRRKFLVKKLRKSGAAHKAVAEGLFKNSSKLSSGERKPYVSRKIKTHYKIGWRQTRKSLELEGKL